MRCRSTPESVVAAISWTFSPLPPSVGGGGTRARSIATQDDDWLQIFSMRLRGLMYRAAESGQGWRDGECACCLVLDRLRIFGKVV
jgi:hypothetical protein